MKRTILREFRQVFYNSSRTFTLAHAFNTKPNLKANSTKKSTGLFNVPELKSQEGFKILTEKCSNRADELAQEAVNINRSRKMVEIFDELSDTLCKTADLAEFIRSVHPHPKYVEAAESVCATMSAIIEKFNTDVKLYKVLKKSVVDGDKVSKPSEIDDFVRKLFLFDFEQSGIHLPEDSRQKVVGLNNVLLQLGHQFTAGSVRPRTIKRNLVPEYVANVFPSRDDSIVVEGLNTNSSNPVIRELSYRVYLMPDPQQELLLAQLLTARHDLAVTCGFETYAHRALCGTILGSPTSAMEFLDELSKNIAKRAENDFETMRLLKASEQPGSETLEPWDVAYYTDKMKQRKFKVSNSEYSPYFSLGVCMEGLNRLLYSLFGITLENALMVPGEVWFDDIYKLEVKHEVEGLLGYIYCDFYERDGKPNQDCHFTIRGGKRLSDGRYQQPIVVLILNLSQQAWSTPPLLSPDMVDNLFHEMGHALHSMLARTRYQHVTGTRCSTDFAEIPSILMEYFAADPRVLKSFARHYQTNTVMPDEMIERLCASKRVFMASEMQLQIFYSILDQVYHGQHPLESSTTKILEETQNRCYGLRYVPNTSWQLRFSHLVGYGAKYYSYLVSKALASWIWKAYFEKDPFHRSQGERYRKQCLVHGGGKPPWDLVADYLGRAPNPDRLVESLMNEIDAKSVVNL